MIYTIFHPLPITLPGVKASTQVELGLFRRIGWILELSFHDFIFVCEVDWRFHYSLQFIMRMNYSTLSVVDDKMKLCSHKPPSGSTT